MVVSEIVLFMVLEISASTDLTTKHVSGASNILSDVVVGCVWSVDGITYVLDAVTVCGLVVVTVTICIDVYP